MMLSRLFSTCALAFALTLTIAGPACADALQDANKLLKQGQTARALEQVDKFLAGKPKDAQGRFLKGLILTEMNKPTEAIGVFQKLTEDYPELPEPYNNLAVIYAQQRQYEKAKQALEMAIRTHPSYATAHENLGDIYSRMASQAYDKALQLDSSNTSAQTKLAMIRNLFGSGARTTISPPLVVAAAEPAPTAPAVKPTEIKPTETKPFETRPTETKPVEPKPVATKPAETKPVQPPVKPMVDAASEAAKTVEAWAAAWSRRDAKAYLAFYAKRFDTPRGQSRADWEAERTKRIEKPAPIDVQLEDLKVSIDGPNKVTARFRQHYKSGAFKSSTRKALAMVREDGKWLIEQERIGN